MKNYFLTDLPNDKGLIIPYRKALVKNVELIDYIDELERTIDFYKTYYIPVHKSQTVHKKEV